MNFINMNNKNKLAFKKQNYILMLIGIALLAIGFIIMTIDENVPHGFGFLGITLGPILVMLGFIVEFFAIMYKAKEQ